MICCLLKLCFPSKNNFYWRRSLNTSTPGAPLFIITAVLNKKVGVQILTHRKGAETMPLGRSMDNMESLVVVVYVQSINFSLRKCGVDMAYSSSCRR